MDNFEWQKQLELMWKIAVQLYTDGNREPATYYNAEQTAWLASVGIRPREMYDFAEDYVDEALPDFPTVAMIQDVRRGYFLEVQGGRWGTARLDPATLPAKDAEAAGIVWLPRIIAKARAKLRGELDDTTMYSCPGDRRFLRTNDIHASEFLRQVWQAGEDDAAIVEWVRKRVV